MICSQLDRLSYFRTVFDTALLQTARVIYLEAVRVLYAVNRFILTPPTGLPEAVHHAKQRGIVYERLEHLPCIPYLRLQHLQLPDRVFNAHQPDNPTGLLPNLVDLVPELEVLSIACTRRHDQRIPYRPISSYSQTDALPLSETEGVQHVLELLFWLIHLMESNCLRSCENGKAMRPLITAALCSRLPSPGAANWASYVVSTIFRRSGEMFLPKRLRQIRILGHNMGYMPWVQMLGHPQTRVLWNRYGMLEAKPLEEGFAKECNLLVKWRSRIGD